MDTLGTACVEKVRNWLKTYNKKISDINGTIMKEILDDAFPRGYPPPARRKVRMVLTDIEWLESLSSEPIAQGISIPSEHNRFLIWCKTNGKGATRRRFINWLINASKDRIVSTPARASSAPARAIPEPAGWYTWTQTNIPNCIHLGKPWKDWPEEAQKHVVKEMNA